MKSHSYVYRVGYSKPTIKHAEILQCLGVSRTTTTTITLWADGCEPEAETPWIDHDGGEMPCKAGQKIEFLFRGQTRYCWDNPEYHKWDWIGDECDIIKWRPVS